MEPKFDKQLFLKVLSVNLEMFKNAMINAAESKAVEIGNPIVRRYHPRNGS